MCTFNWTGVCALEAIKYKRRAAWRLRQSPRLHGTWSVDEGHSRGKVLSIAWNRIEKRGLAEVVEAARHWGAVLGDAVHKVVLPPAGSSDFLLVEMGPRRIVKHQYDRTRHTAASSLGLEQNLKPCRF